MKRHGSRPTRFGWQIVLIAAPVLILSAISLYSLRQDRAAVEQDARDRARTLVSSLSNQWRESVSKDVEAFLTDYYLATYVPVASAWPEASGIFQAEDAEAIRPLVERARATLMLDSVPQIRCRIAAGRMEAPIEYPPLPVPADWMKALSPTQAELLQGLESALYRERNPASAAQVLAKMRAARAPEPALAHAEIGILMSEAAQGAGINLRAKLIDLARKYPESTSPSGTPVADLALIRALKTESSAASEGGLRQEAFRRVYQYPSFLTPEIIAAAKPLGSQAVQALEALWHEQEVARAFLRLARDIPADPAHKVTQFWLQSQGRHILAQRSQDFYQQYSITLMPGRVLERAFLKALDTIRPQIPAYASPEVEIAGRTWPVDAGRLGAPENQEVLQLASYSGGFAVQMNPNAALYAREKSLLYLAPPDSYSMVYTLNLRLTRPDLLYAAHQRRLWYAGGFILAAAAAAAIGLLNAWRGFRRQLQLAEMTSNFVSSVSHELRAPLASMRLMAESLDRGRVEDEGKRKDYFRSIVQECRRLSSLVENVLDFSRIHQGRRQYEFEPVDGIALIGQSVRTMEPVAIEHGLSVSFEAKPGEDLISRPVWDGPAVQQAVVNLLDNAIKHSPAGSVIKVGIEMAGDRRVQVTVEDQGPGIRAQDQERIFDPFHRLGSELRRETRGIGIGLSIVKHVAEAHGGRVFVESTPGQGSRFTLELALTPQS